jgi:hypothetical protein
MACKLIESARDSWRAVNAPHLVALVSAGAVFRNGALIERPGQPLLSRLIVESLLVTEIPEFVVVQVLQMAAPGVISMSPRVHSIGGAR